MLVLKVAVGMVASSIGAAIILWGIAESAQFAFRLIATSSKTVARRIRTRRS
jgi:hypothetical protein